MLGQALPALGGALAGAWTPAAGGASLAGSIAVTATCTGALTVPKPLSGTIAASVSTSGALTVPKPLAGSLAATVTISGALAGGGALLSGSIAIVTTTSGALTVPKPLGGTLAISVATAGALTVPKPLAGSLGVVVSIQGALAGGPAPIDGSYLNGVLTTMARYRGEVFVGTRASADLAMIAAHHAAITTATGEDGSLTSLSGES